MMGDGTSDEMRDVEQQWSAKRQWHNIDRAMTLGTDYGSIELLPSVVSPYLKI